VDVAGQSVLVQGRVTAAGPVAVVARDNLFKPNLITARPGSTVTLDLRNDGHNLHNVSVPDQGVDSDVQPAGSRDLDISVPASGQVVFFCKYHRKASGMIGVVRTL
jgi:plastocyanin